MRYSRVLLPVLAALLILAAPGCLHPDEEASIEPLPAAGRSDPGLGPGNLSLSSGPGYKGSPSWSPRGDRIAFTVDGYVVDKPVRAGTVRRWTTRDFVAEKAEWTGGGLAILAAASREGAPGKLYGARADEGSLGVEEVAAEVLAMGLGPEGAGLAVARETGPGESELAPVVGGRVGRPYAEVSGGLISSFSFSPDGRRAVVAVRQPGHMVSHELRVFDLRENTVSTVKLEGGLGVFGAPQWTDRGIYYVAGEKEASGERAGGEESTGLYGLYRVPYRPGDGARPERAPGVGEDFVAASARVSPDGKRLAVIGRLNPESPTNLYVQDVAAEDLEAATANEDMEIKTGPEDLAWSPDGGSVAIVARGAPSEEPAVLDGPADALLEDFYNLYEVPVG